MPSFLLAYLLIPFGLVLFVAVLFFFFNVFHLKRYAIRSEATTTLIVMYFVSFGVLLALMGGYMLSVDWSERFQLSDLLPSFERSSRFE